MKEKEVLNTQNSLISSNWIYRNEIILEDERRGSVEYSKYVKISFPPIEFIEMK